MEEKCEESNEINISMKVMLDDGSEHDEHYNIANYLFDEKLDKHECINDN